MLSQEMIKAPYYPSVFYTQRLTPFGAIETSHPDLYTQPISGKKILRVDALAAVATEQYCGESILQTEEVRSLAYKLFSGNCTDEVFQKLLVSFYVKHPQFMNYVDEKVQFGDESQTIVTRLIKPIRDAITEYSNDVLYKINHSGGKVVMTTHDYIYAIFKHDKLPLINHSKVIV